MKNKGIIILGLLINSVFGQLFEGKLTYTSTVVFEGIDSTVNANEYKRMMEEKGILYDTIELYVNDTLGYIKYIPQIELKSMFSVNDEFIYTNSLDKNNLIIATPSKYNVSLSDMKPSVSDVDTIIDSVNYRIVKCKYFGGISYNYYQVKDSLLFDRSLFINHELEGLNNLFLDGWSLPIYYELVLPGYFKISYKLVEVVSFKIEESFFENTMIRLKNRMVLGHPDGKIYRKNKHWNKIPKGTTMPKHN